MSATHGFWLEHLIVSGPELPDAILEFSDGLNVVAGASNTGKSYAFSCIDYAFGAGKPPKKIKEAVGYHSLTIRVVARSTGERYDIVRSLAGGDIELRKLGVKGEVVETKTLSAKHAADNPDTISGRLLQWTGLWGRKLRAKQRGDQKSLSFRDVAFLILVDENRMFEERPPQVSEVAQTKTADLDTLRLLLTGQESAPVIGLQSKKVLGDNKAKNELLQEMIVRAEADYRLFGVTEDALPAEIDRVNQARNAALSDYDMSREDTVEMEKMLAELGRTLRDVRARALVVEGLQKRFQLLDSHYESDLKRLQAIEETGALLESFPARSCPVCGSAPDQHRTGECAMGYRLDDVQAAAHSESAKVSMLKLDLARTLTDLAEEAGLLVAKEREVTEEMALTKARIAGELMPRVRQSAETLRDQTDQRERLLRAQNTADQLKQLRVLATELQAPKITKPEQSPVEAAATTAELDAFSEEVESLLKEWNYPDLGRVVFSENEQDLVIGGQVRTTNGKGVRALTCAAFVLGISRHCQRKKLPHPSLVILDSPLVAYEEPKSGETISVEDEKLRKAGIKEAFYATLAQGSVGGQIIIFENDDPPSDITDGLKRQHFTKTESGRHGFFPRPNP